MVSVNGYTHYLHESTRSWPSFHPLLPRWITKIIVPFMNEVIPLSLSVMWLSEATSKMITGASYFFILSWRSNLTTSTNSLLDIIVNWTPNFLGYLAHRKTSPEKYFWWISLSLYLENASLNAFTGKHIIIFLFLHLLSPVTKHELSFVGNSSKMKIDYTGKRMIEGNEATYIHPLDSLWLQP